MGRVNPFADENLSDFQPKSKPKTTPEDKAVIEQVAEQTGFVSRQVKPAVSAVVELGSRTRRRYTTGRNQQLNIKVTEDAMKRFYAIADQLNLPLGEVFDRALKAYEEQQK